jgi:predicted phage terminase large subunit-like protein
VTEDEFFIDPELLDSASPGQRQKYIQLLKARRALRSPLDYALYVTPSAKAHRHSKYLSDLLVALVEWRLYKDGPGPESIIVDVSEELPHGRHVHPETGEEPLRKLMVSLPPQIGKSFMIGRHFPSWFLTKYPEEGLMYLSYAASLAEIYTANNKNNIKRHPELGIALAEDNASSKEFGIEGHEGGMLARGIEGVPTGRGGNLIIDDPFQDGRQAMNDDRRDFVWNQYTSSILPRVRDGCFQILVNTRWHEDDLSGRFLEHEPDDWYVVNIPAISFDTVDSSGVSVDPDTGARDVFDRRPGEAVCPEIATVKFYRKKQEADPFWFDAEYLGKPSGIGGSLFKEFSHYTRHQMPDGTSVYELFTGGDSSEFVSEKDCVRFMTADTALTDKQTSDWTVLGVWDLGPLPERRLILREVIREKITGDRLEDRIREEYAKWDIRVFGVEEATVSIKLIQDMIAEGGITIWPLPADKNKKIRAIPAAVLLKRKKLLVDKDATWRTKYESELKKFDKDKHDDQVDMTAYAPVMRDLLQARPAPPSRHADATALRGFEARLAEIADSEDPKQPTTRMVINGG